LLTLPRSNILKKLSKITIMLSVEHLQELFLKYLKKELFDQSPKELYEPVNYILQLGGKRLRPVLLLMGTNLFSEEIEQAFPAALAIEIFHNFSLVHDDIMDEAPLRRGQPTVHIKYGQNAGILSGDAMLILTYQYLSQLKNPNQLPTILRIFNQLAIEVCEGQQYDMNFETQESVEIAAYLKMIELKTSVLIAGGLKIGALIGGAAEKDANELYEFGRHIGIAFQLQDDILDTFGDPEKFGKKVGGDIAQNKKTFLLLKSMEQARGQDRVNLLDALSDATNPNQKIEKVTSIYQKLKVQEQASELMEDYLKKAFIHLDRVKVEESRKILLRNLANQLMMREI